MEIGSIVVCVDDGNWWNDIMEYFKVLPVKGQLYTIRMIIPNMQDPNGLPGVALEEIRGKIDTVKTYTGSTIQIEVHFKIKRFKEVLAPESISIEDFIDSQEEINDVRKFETSNRVSIDSLISLL